ncbi:glycosyltransferase [Candidatus Fermentibacteria bacterium]|nr:glycosyltransferase [Candidatus Fermentibacteria bacterium]
MDSLLLVANDLFHHHEHRIRHLAAFLESLAPLRKVSLVPPGIGISGDQAPPGSPLRGWPRRVVGEGCPLIWLAGTTTAVRRSPLPSLLGPVINRVMLRTALRAVAPVEKVALVQGPVPAMACRDRGIRFIYDHADDYGGGRVDGPHRWILNRWQECALRGATSVSCAGFSLQRHAAETGAKSTHLYPNGVHTRLFGLPRAESPEPTILYVGGLERDCGLDVVLRAFPLMKREIRIVVAGDGPARRPLASLAQRLGLASFVTWHGSISSNATPPLMAAAWVGLAILPPTRWNRYAFHLKILEYMAAGLPFVTTPVGDGARIARESGAGVVTRPEPSAVAACLTELLDAADRRTGMSLRGRETAAQYDWNVIGPRFARWVRATLAEMA